VLAFAVASALWQYAMALAMCARFPRAHFCWVSVRSFWSGVEVVGFLVVAFGVGRLLGWRGGCRLRDPPAVMASALEDRLACCFVFAAVDIA
jgi:hypothetical protein